MTAVRGAHSHLLFFGGEDNYVPTSHLFEFLSNNMKLNRICRVAYISIASVSASGEEPAYQESVDETNNELPNKTMSKIAAEIVARTQVGEMLFSKECDDRNVNIIPDVVKERIRKEVEAEIEKRFSNKLS